MYSLVKWYHIIIYEAILASHHVWPREVVVYTKLY